MGAPVEQGTKNDTWKKSPAAGVGVDGGGNGRRVSWAATCGDDCRAPCDLSFGIVDSDQLLQAMANVAAPRSGVARSPYSQCTGHIHRELLIRLASKQANATDVIAKLTSKLTFK